MVGADRGGFHRRHRHADDVAAQLFELAANIPGRYQIRSRYQLAHTHNRLGKKLLEAKQTDEAKTHFLAAAGIFLEIMDKHPDQMAGPKEYLWAAEVFREQGKYPQAICAYEALIERYPKEADAAIVYWLGQLAISLKQPDHARAEKWPEIVLLPYDEPTERLKAEYLHRAALIKRHFPRVRIYGVVMNDAWALDWLGRVSDILVANGNLSAVRAYTREHGPEIYARHGYEVKE